MESLILAFIAFIALELFFIVCVVYVLIDIWDELQNNE